MKFPQYSKLFVDCLIGAVAMGSDPADCLWFRVLSQKHLFCAERTAKNGFADSLFSLQIRIPLKQNRKRGAGTLLQVAHSKISALR